ncbi:MAG TPA: FAD-dependent monooxygenase [Amycolatopsis sp.]|nr:FAD-dependent monooxygenase [Amycolatopsis sp.]
MDRLGRARTPVLIVGGGPVGLALALDLAQYGVRSTLVERRPGAESELLAKAGTLNARSLEFCRRWDVAGAVANWGADADFPRDTCYVTSLANGYLLGRDKVASARERKAARSPEMLRKCPQHIFDPLLAGRVAATGRTDLRYGVEARHVVQDRDGVTVELVHDGGTEQIRAGYVVACDGAASGIRGELGIPFDGRTLDFSVSAMIRVRDLAAYHDVGNATRYLFVGTNGNWANLTSVDYGDLWRFTVFGSEERIAPDRIDLRPTIDEAFGRPDIPYELLRALPWRRSQCCARTYRRGRVLLAGDAAHTMSNTGGHGLNTGLGDVFGLGWMLAAQVRGWGGPGLLDAYDAERRPVGIRNAEASTRNYRGWISADIDFSGVLDGGPGGDATRSSIARRLSEALYPEWHSEGVALGYRYENSPVIVADGTPEPADDVVEYVPTARPGHRAPHAWLPDGRSTIDLFGPWFTLLRLGKHAPGTGPFTEAAALSGLPLRVESVDDPGAAALYERSLVLVRPDGHVAWRDDSLPADVPALLDQVRGCR